MIGVCSYGTTGSQAFIDLLKEYDNLEVLDKKEFVISYFPNGLEDLEYHLMNQKAKFYSSDIGIKNFLEYMNAICHNNKSYYYKLTDGHFSEIVDNYINKICDVNWQGRWIYDDLYFKSIFQKIKFAIFCRIKKLNYKTYRHMRFSMDPENFYIETERFLKQIYNYRNINKTFVLDQPFPATNPLNSMRLYGDDSKAIVVLRDPRDMYYMMKKYNGSDGCGWAPVNSVENFIKFYKTMYSYRCNNKNILYIYFEELIFNYEDTVKKIEEFCDISNDNHKTKYKYFDPNKSLKNTQLFIKNSEYDKEIKIIEKEMKDYLYDFSSTNGIDYSKDVF